MKNLQEEIEATLTLLGKNVSEAKVQIQSFLKSIEPIVSAAIEKGDLQVAQDQIASRLTRVSLGLLHRERQTILAAVMTTLRMQIKYETTGR